MIKSILGIYCAYCGGCYMLWPRDCMSICHMSEFY